VAGYPDPRSGERPEPETAWWRPGLLILLAGLIVVGIVLLVRGCGDDPSGATAGPDSSSTTEPGETPDHDGAPDFSVDLFGGGTFVLSEHLRDDGRPVILNLWASWCPPCTAEMPDLDEAAAAHPGVLFLGVAVDDDPIAAEDFVEMIEVSYPTGFDAGGLVNLAYPAPGLPATYVISSDGDLVRTVFGRVSTQDIEALVSVALAG
jgi:thiol-disulfide isomerase/thioredoxin